MKRIFLMVAIFLPLLFFSCKWGDGNPKAVMMQFFEALSKKDIATARKLSTDGSKATIDFLERILMDPNTKEAEKFDKTKLEVGEANIEGNNASIPVTEKVTGETLNYILKKVNGSWKMAFDQESMENMSTEQPTTDMNKIERMNMDSLNETLKK